MSMERTLEQEAVDRCARAGLALAVAESCTGGLIAHRITNVPGASRVFKGGVTAYANSAKMQLLGVSDTILAEHGAVSEPTALAMVRGARRALDADVAVAVTGIAGPDGGSPDKPVGTVYVAVSGPRGERVRLEHFSGDRAAIKSQTADAALRMVAHLLEEA